MKLVTNVVIVFGLFNLLAFISCKQTNKTKKRANTSFTFKDHILLETSFDSEGKLESVKHFRNSRQIGAEIEYYGNGKIKKWKWYGPEGKYPWIVIYYDSNGTYDGFKGEAIISAVKFKNSNKIYVEMINPPFVKCIFGCKDYYNNVLVKRNFWDPGTTDSTAWVGLQVDSLQENHKYSVLLYFADSIHHKLIDSTKERQLDR